MYNLISAENPYLYFIPESMNLISAEIHNYSIYLFLIPENMDMGMVHMIIYLFAIVENIVNHIQD